MRRILIIILNIALLFILGTFMVSGDAEAAKKSNTYWICGVTSEMETGIKTMKVSFNGYDLYVNGYISKANTLTKAFNKEKKKIKKKHFKITKSCKVDAGMGPENIKIFLKRNKKGKITGFVELKIKQGKVVKIQYGS